MMRPMLILAIYALSQAALVNIAQKRYERRMRRILAMYPEEDRDAAKIAMMLNIEIKYHKSMNIIGITCMALAVLTLFLFR